MHDSWGNKKFYGRKEKKKRKKKREKFRPQMHSF
jgi:hypothetical protein